MSRPVRRRSLALAGATLLILLGTTLPAAAVDPPPPPGTYWIHYPSVDGLTIPALVFPSDDPDSTKAVIYARGGWDGNVATITTGMAQLWALTDLGYWVIAPDYRGSSGHGKTLKKAIDVSGKDVDDVALAAAWATAHLGVRTFVFLGGSRGAPIVAGLAYRYPTLGAGYSIISCPCDWKTQYPFLPSAAQTQLRNSIGGTPAQNPAGYEARSFRYNIAPVVRPLLIFHGTKDKLVPLPYAYELRDAVLAAGKTLEFGVYTGGHGFFSTDDLSAVWWQDWLTWLQGVTA